MQKNTMQRGYANRQFTLVRIARLLHRWSRHSKKNDRATGQNTAEYSSDGTIKRDETKSRKIAAERNKHRTMLVLYWKLYLKMLDDYALRLSRGA